MLAGVCMYNSGRHFVFHTINSREKKTNEKKKKKVHIIQYLFNILCGASVHQADVRCVYTKWNTIKSSVSCVYFSFGSVKIISVYIDNNGRSKSKCVLNLFFTPFRHIILSYFNSWTLYTHTSLVQLVTCNALRCVVFFSCLLKMPRPRARTPLWTVLIFSRKPIKQWCTSIFTTT